MGGGKGKKKERKSLTPELYFGNALAFEQDRGCVLVGAAYIEYRIEELLRVRLKATPECEMQLVDMIIGDADNSQALLYSGWAKAVVLRVFGIIDRDNFRLFNRIRKLRNHFAHTPAETLLDEEAVAPIVDALNGERKATLQVCLNAMDNGQSTMWSEFGHQQVFSKARITFMQACAALNGYIVGQLDILDPTGKAGRHISAVAYNGARDWPIDLKKDMAAIKKHDN
jgi:hypothetical protein